MIELAETQGLTEKNDHLPASGSSTSASLSDQYGVPLLSDNSATTRWEREETSGEPCSVSEATSELPDGGSGAFWIRIDNDKKPKTGVSGPWYDDRAPLSSPTFSTNSASIPLLSDDEEGPDCDDAATLLKPQETKSKPSTKVKSKAALSHFVRIFSYSTLGDKALLFAAACSSVFTGITLPLMNVVFGQLVGAFSAFYAPESGDNKDMFIDTINQYVLYLIYLFFCRLFLDYIAILGFRIVSIRISAALRLSYLRALLRQPVSILDSLPPGQTASIITITANTLQIGISEKLSMLLQSTSLVITALVIAFRYNWLLSLVTSSGLVFIVISHYVTIPLLMKRIKQVDHADRMSSSIASEVFGMVRMVAACQAESKMTKRFTSWVEESRRQGLLMSPLVAIQQAPVVFAIHATFALSFWYAIKLYSESDITDVKIIIIVLMSIMTIVMSIGGIAGPVTTAAQAATAASIFFTIIDAPQSETVGFTDSKVSLCEDIVLGNITFAYPSRPHIKVLDDLSVRFPAGKMTAIVGASGSGKSTIVGLLERWYELDGNMTNDIVTLFFRTGNITIGGVNLYEIDLKWWRSQIGLVQQEPFLFNDTIYRNVECGLIGTKWEHDDDKQKMEIIKLACKEAFADEFISRLPLGYETQVGDAGIKLSGGQRQRLAIARSIVKRPSILILDEATSAIDVHAEKVVQAALESVSKNRTTIMIAHRLSTIMRADNIVVLQKGKVVGQGTHNTLMADEAGPYWAFANTQKLAANTPRTECSGETESEKQEANPYSSTQNSLDQGSVGSDPPVAKSTSFVWNFSTFLWEQKHQSKWYGLMLLGALGAGAAFPLHAFLFAKLISLFNFWGQYLQDQTNFWCLMFTLLAVEVGISYFILGWSSNHLAFNITSAYRQEYFHNILSKPVSFYDEEANSIGALTSRIAADPTQLQQLLGINMAIVFISVFNIIGCISMSFYFGWKLTLLTVCTAMPVILAAGYFRVRYEMKFEQMSYEVFAESSKFATECIGAFRTVSSLTMESAISKRYENLLKTHTISACQQAQFSTFIFAVSDSISLLCMAFVQWYGAKLLASYEYAPFNYLVIYLAVVQGSTSAGQSLSFGPNIAHAFAASRRIQSMRPKVKDDRRAGMFELDSVVTIEDGPIRGVKLDLEDIWFQYPTREVPVLRGLNMTIEKGQFAAIVGPSGCGKTSIISLLERFYTIQHGRIKCDGIDINELSLSSYRKSLSLVAQEAALFEGTVRENVLLGTDETKTSDEVLFQACRDAEIHHFITSLHEGYNTAIGATGITLSGGQKQRIAIARALVRNPRVLLLDEATSNLDSETEKSVQAVLEKTAKGRTMVIVAHRLATVQNADAIFVINDGTVAEVGNHSALLQKRGLYYQMCQSQALDR